MPTRHEVDTSLRFDPDQAVPPRRDIERLVVDPAGETKLSTETVESEPYVASGGLVDAVNVAIALGRPLLLQGDPGAGKTRLAHAVAYALELSLETAYIKSTSRGQDLLYTFDSISRLYDAQLTEAGKRPDARRYVRLGPLGQAIARAAEGRRSVVLIDEIDKADLDFPNDLLHEIDRLAFDVSEVPGLRYDAGERSGNRPIIIVTNNEEKALPAAFLRRCVFHYVEFPDDPKVLKQIMRLHGITAEGLRGPAAQTLLEIRALGLDRKPGLSELLDWASYLQATGTDPEIVDLANLPYPGALVKQHSDQAKLWSRAGRP